MKNAFSRPDGGKSKKCSAHFQRRAALRQRYRCQRPDVTIEIQALFMPSVHVGISRKTVKNGSITLEKARCFIRRLHNSLAQLGVLSDVYNHEILVPAARFSATPTSRFFTVCLFSATLGDLRPFCTYPMRTSAVLQVVVVIRIKTNSTSKFTRYCPYY